MNNPIPRDTTAAAIRMMSVVSDIAFSQNVQNPVMGGLGNTFTPKLGKKKKRKR